MMSEGRRVVSVLQLQIILLTLQMKQLRSADVKGLTQLRNGRTWI